MRSLYPLERVSYNFVYFGGMFSTCILHLALLDKEFTTDCMDTAQILKDSGVNE